MTEQPPAPSSSAVMPITEPNPNDVLLGRGPFFNKFEGNLRFQKLIKERKLQYNSPGTSRQEKNRIAKEAVAAVHAAGGRFLKQEDPADPYNENWYEVERAVSEEKAKQALREKQPAAAAMTSTAGASLNHRASNDARTFSPGLFTQEAGPAFVNPHLLLFQENSCAASQREMALQSLLMNPELANAVLNNPFVVPKYMRMSLFQDLCYRTALTASALQQNNVEHVASTHAEPLQDADEDALCLQGLLHDLHDGGNVEAVDPSIDWDLETKKEPPSLPNNAGDDEHACLTPRTATESRSSQDADEDVLRLRLVQDLSDGDNVKFEQGIDLDLETEKGLSPSGAGDDEFAFASDIEHVAFLLSTLGLTDRKIMTEEEEIREKELLTDEEKAKLLVDAFGKMCQDEAPRKKRAKRDLDPSSISFLVRQMKCEIERIPAHGKNALMEAQAKCSSDEFSDARLEKFLRCEGMNAQLAAQRFVKYWKCRREVFGPDKFTEPMTLSGAFRDDLKALQTGVSRLLPKPDLSGRPIMITTPSLNTRDGYDSDSLIRAHWYVKEVLARENTHPQSGFVSITWGEGLTIWDYDSGWDRLTEYVTAHPIKDFASHLCCMPRIVTKVVFPVIRSLMDKETRTHTMMHDASPSEFLRVLSPYGIEKDMLPLELGGYTYIEFDQVEWIENRRALEMGEIE